MLCSNLSEDISKMDESQIKNNNIENAEYSHAMRAVFSYTTYAENDDLSYIVLAIDNMIGPGAIYEPIRDLEILKQLTSLSYNITSEEIASSLHEQLSKSLQLRAPNY